MHTHDVDCLLTSFAVVSLLYALHWHHYSNSTHS